MEEARTLCGGEEAQEAIRHLTRLLDSLAAFGLGEQVTVDLGLVHRHEYYTGVVFRGYIAGSGETVVSGGRYDTLLQRFGSDLPAVGFGLNLDAVTRVMLEEGTAEPALVPEILVYAEPGREIDALRKIQELTEQELSICEFSTFSTLEQTLSYARRRGIARVLSLGEKGVETFDL